MKKFLLTVAGLVSLVLLCLGAGNGYSPRLWGNGFFTNSIVATTKSCRLYSINGYNGNAGTTYVMVFQTNAVPANGTICTLGPIPVGTGQYFSWNLSSYGAPLDFCTVCVSSTAQSLTLDNTNCTIQVIAEGLQ